MTNHSTYCNCKECCLNFVDHSKMPLETFKKAVLRKGYDMFGPKVHSAWSGSMIRPYLTEEEEAIIPRDSPLL